MIRSFVPDNGRLRVADDPLQSLDSALWIDLIEPTDAEEAALEQHFRIDIPTREEMQAIEVSSRLYLEDDATFMTATLPARTDTDDLLMWPITFVLIRDKLITVRYHEPRAFKTFPQRVEQVSLGCTRGDIILVALLEADVDRIADMLERAQHDVDGISHDIFAADSTRATRDYQGVLRQIGRKGDLVSNLRDSLLSLVRMMGFFGQTVAESDDGSYGVESRRHARYSGVDGPDLVPVAEDHVPVGCDARLVNIEQSNIIKIFTIAAGVFLPPTLIASIYGMNFVHMPELRWQYGYPLAVIVMVLSAVVPCLVVQAARAGCSSGEREPSAGKAGAVGLPPGIAGRFALADLEASRSLEDEYRGDPFPIGGAQACLGPRHSRAVPHAAVRAATAPATVTETRACSTLRPVRGSRMWP